MRAGDTLERFYEMRNGALAWTGAANAPAYRDLVAAVAAAEKHGLDPSDYHFAELTNGHPGTGDARLDRIASDAYLMLASHLSSGRLDPITVEPNWTAERQGRDLAGHLDSALADGGDGAIGTSLDILAPAQGGYADLQAALARYKQIAERGGWPRVDAGTALRAGDRGQRVQQLRRRLAATGELSGEGRDLEVFDDRLDDAVRRYQRRANLRPDGIVGPRTLAHLNASVADRIDQIRANMERWRWLPDDLGRRHIRLNIADFQLEAWANGRVDRIHDVVVGRVHRETPVFSDLISYLVLNPWWETPPSLAARDKLPAFREDPQSVAALGFQVIDREGRIVALESIDWHAIQADDFPYRLRQAPGPLNALGDVKFMFPNRHNVYLHDTPSQGLFAESRRDFSSGCVRVQDPLDLAAWVLRETTGWPVERIRSVAMEDVETRVNVARPVPVHILYWTAVSDEQTTVRFIDDIYQRDADLIAALERR